MVTACMLATEMAATSASCYHTVQTSAASPSLKRPFSGSNSIQWTLRVHRVSLYLLFVPFNTIREILHKDNRLFCKVSNAWCLLLVIYTYKNSEYGGICDIIAGQFKHLHPEFIKKVVWSLKLKQYPFSKAHQCTVLVGVKKIKKPIF